MRTSTKKILSTIVLVTVISFNVNAQTNVGGGIFSNTTWTLAGSPYIVIDTTVVFPGVTLTIEPGVVVKFDDNMYLEIRQGTLISTGTVTDSITFTSNSPAPAPGIWGAANDGGILLNGATPTAFNFCNVKYATRGIGGGAIQYLKNSSFTYNEYGIYNIAFFPVDSCVFKYNTTGISNLNNATLNFCTISNNYFGVEDSYTNAVLNNCTIDSNHRAFGGVTGQTASTKFYNCSISHNDDGVIFHSAGGNVLRDCIINYNRLQGVWSGNMGNDSIINCEIKFNAIGITAQSSSGCVITQCEIEYDTIGIAIKSSSADIYCNKICNNISYGLRMDISSNFNVSDNYWCTTDSAQIAAAIYDGYDNVAVGLVTFFPLDSLCYTATGIPAYEAPAASFSIFPNPAADEITIELPSNSSKAEIKIFNMPGELVYSSRLAKQKTTIDISAFMKGAYIIQIATADTISRQKLIRQ